MSHRTWEYVPDAASVVGGLTRAQIDQVEGPRYTGRQVWNRQRTDRELAPTQAAARGCRQN
jgi:hypothetical protein